MLVRVFCVGCVVLDVLCVVEKIEFCELRFHRLRLTIKINSLY